MGQPRKSVQVMKHRLRQIDEPLPGVPLLELAGESRVLIENHYGVSEYSRERVGVKVRFGVLLVCGCGLELAKLSKDQLVISGRIDGIQVIRGRKG